jgi:Lipopolysaccharide-assembly
MRLQTARTSFFGCVTVVLFAALGCGYQTGGRAVRLPTDTHTIYVPAFANQSHTYNLEQKFTAALVRELHSRTNYRIVTTNDGTADVILNGKIVSTTIVPLTYNAQTGGISTGLIFVTAKVSLVNSKGKVLWDNPNWLYRDQYQLSSSARNFFEEESPALDRLASDFAKSLVSDILEAY